VAVIKVGAAPRRNEEKRLGWKTPCTRRGQAVEEGIVPGGGVALARFIAAIDKLKVMATSRSRHIVKRSLEEPLRQIVGNAGARGCSDAGQGAGIERPNYGYNVDREF